MVNEIIPRYPAYKDKYLEAARTWRLPFWDFAKNPRIPQMVRYRKVTITFGGEPKMEIENPLYQFRMPNEKKMKVYGVGPIVNFDGGDSLEVGSVVDAAFPFKCRGYAYTQVHQDWRSWLYA